MSGPWLHRVAVLVAAAAFVFVAAGATAPSLGEGSHALAGVGKALLLHLVFAATVLGAVRTSMAWKNEQPQIEDGGWPPLRSLALLTPPLVIVQVALGASYRQELLGLIPHATWAFATAIVVLAEAAFVLTQDNGHRPMKLWAIALLSVTGLQLILGVLAFVGRLAATESGSLDGWAAGAVHAHVGAGSLVLGFTAALSAWILRDVTTVRSGRHAVSSGRQS